MDESERLDDPLLLLVLLFPLGPRREGGMADWRCCWAESRPAPEEEGGVDEEEEEDDSSTSAY